MQQVTRQRSVPVRYEADVAVIGGGIAGAFRPLLTDHRHPRGLPHRGAAMAVAGNTDAACIDPVEVRGVVEQRGAHLGVGDDLPPPPARRTR